MSWKTKLKIIIGILLLIFLTNTCTSVYNSGKGLYNTTVAYKLDYEKAKQELVTFYDNKYLAFSKKEGIANVNKDVFIVVTEIIMSNRKDGQQLAWKWVHENQNIPYGEFTDFYRELSAFVNEQYDGIFAIERKKQEIVAAHNKLISLWPNNFYNGFLHIKPLVYEFGYVTPETKARFNLK